MVATKPAAAAGFVPVSAGVIGLGEFGAAILAQSRRMAALSVPVVADRDVEAAVAACLQSGIAEDDLTVCDNRAQALAALERRQQVILSDPLALVALPLDVIVEATGSAEAGAVHAATAIEHGRHVAMVTKEADAVVGPILKHRADRAGVVYRPVDGDQPGLLISMVAWARKLGLDIVCAGKARDVDVAPDIIPGPNRGIGPAAWSGGLCGELSLLGLHPIEATMASRREALGDRAEYGSYDLEELAIVANATGLLPDRPFLHAPVVRTSEIPTVLRPRADGGILERRGVIDLVSCLREPGSPGLGGGVFLVVACDDTPAGRVLSGKGTVTDPERRYALLYRPYHLCGVEAPMTILRAVGHDMTSGAGAECRPRVDVVVQAREDLPEHRGALWPDSQDLSHSKDLIGRLETARAIAGPAPLPMQLLSGQRLHRSVRAGETITADHVSRPGDSALWRLREEQDALYLNGSHLPPCGR